jgi:phosphohistidine phosphatase
MLLYLVQHGEAAPEDLDPERKLTEKGTADVRKIANLLRPLGLTVKSVWRSEKARAKETSEILGPVVGVSVPSERSGLSPNDPIHPIQEEIAGADGDLMIVGHLPFLGKLASALLTGSESADIVAFQQGGILCLERLQESGWKTRWMIIPNLLK